LLWVLTSVRERKSVRPPEVALVSLVRSADPIGIVVQVTRAATLTQNVRLLRNKTDSTLAKC
jgi:hypothetical protein